MFGVVGLSIGFWEKNRMEEIDLSDGEMLYVDS
jgi:hypothetical protein